MFGTLFALLYRQGTRKARIMVPPKISGDSARVLFDAIPRFQTPPVQIPAPAAVPVGTYLTHVVLSHGWDGDKSLALKHSVRIYESGQLEAGQRVNPEAMLADLIIEENGINLNAEGFISQIEMILTDIDAGKQLPLFNNAMVKKMRQLLAIDRAGNRDGVITVEDLEAWNKNLANQSGLGETKVSEEALKAWKVFAAKIANAVSLYNQGQLDAARQSDINQNLLVEMPGSPFHLQTSRSEMVAEILYVANEGYLTREMKRAQGGTKALFDFVTAVFRKPVEWVAEGISGEERYSDITQEWINWAQSSKAARDLAVEGFLQELAKRVPESGRFNSLEEAETAIEESVVAVGRNPDYDRSSGLWGSNFGFGLVLGVDGAEEYLRRDYPLDQMAILLSAPKGDLNALVGSLKESADFLGTESSDINSGWNWQASEYLYSIVISAVENLNFEGKDQFLQDAKLARAAQLGDNTEYNPIAAQLFPHFWETENLTSELRYTMGEDIASWLVPMGGAPKALSGMAKLFGRVFKPLSIAITKSPRLNKFLSIMAQADPKTVAIMREGAELSLHAGQKVPEKLLSKLARKDPRFIQGLSANTIKEGDDLLRVVGKSSEEIKALRQETLLALNGGDKLEIAAALRKTVQRDPAFIQELGKTSAAQKFPGEILSRAERVSGELTTLRKTAIEAIQKGEKIDAKILEELAHKDPQFLRALVQTSSGISEDLLRTAAQTLEATSAKLGARSQKIARAFGMTGNVTWRVVINPSRRLVGALSKGIAVMGKGAYRGSQLAMPRLTHSITSAGSHVISHPKVLAVGAGIKGNWKGVFAAYVGIQVAGEPFVRNPIKIEKDPAWKIRYDGKGEAKSKLRIGLDQALMESPQESIHLGQSSFNSQQNLGERELGVLAAQTYQELSNKGYDASHGIVLRYLGSRTNSGEASQLDHPDFIVSRIINNPFLAELGIAYVGPEGTVVSQNHLGQENREDSSPMLLDFDARANWDRMDDIWYHNEQAMRLNSALENENNLTLLRQMLGRDTAFPQDYPFERGAHQFLPNLSDNPLLIGAQKTKLYEIPQETFQVSLVEIEGHCFMVLVDSSYLEQVDQAVAGI